MYRDNTTNEEYPKTLLIRNTVGGVIWQVYHVEKEIEAQRLSTNANRHGFADRELIDYDTNHEETYPGWRETSGGKKICK